MICEPESKGGRGRHKHITWLSGSHGSVVSIFSLGNEKAIPKMNVELLKYNVMSSESNWASLLPGEISIVASLVNNRAQVYI